MEEKYPVKEMLDRYGFYRQKYVMMRPEFTNHVDNPYTSKQMWEHLNGLMSLCVFAGPHNTSFLSIDVDMKDHEVVRKVINTMVELGFPRERIYVSDSGNKGYHVDVFFERSIYNWMARQMYDLIIFFGKLDKRKVEFRPTDKQAIKLPLGVHQKTGRRCWFVNPDTFEPIETFDYIATTEKIEPWRIDQILKDGNKRRFYIMLEEAKAKEADMAKTPRKRRVAGASNIYIDEVGTRQQCMVEEALRLYRAGGDYDSIHRGLVDWMGLQDPAMYKDSWQECMRNIDNITGWVMRAGRRQELGDDPTHEYHTNIRIYRSDMNRILRAPTKNARLLAFLFTVFCDKYEFCGLSEKKLASLLSVQSKITVIKASDAIVEKKLFYKTKGGYRNIGNTLKPVTNKYKFPTDYQRSGEYIEINDMVTADNLYELYIRTLASMFDYKDLIMSLSKPELVDVRYIKEAEPA